MRKTIYHGSDKIVRVPGFGAGNAMNDFGLGFYCCEQAGPAAEWAVSFDRNGFVSAYSIETEGLRIVNLCSTQYCALHWLYVLLSFREFESSSPLVNRAKEYINKNFAVDHQGCDCMTGWRADNSCFALAQDFLEGSISYRSLARALASNDSNRQFVLKSNRAFERISYTGYETAAAAGHYPAAVSREVRILKEAKSSYGKEGLFVDRLIEEDVKPYDMRLR